MEKFQMLFPFPSTTSTSSSSSSSSTTHYSHHLHHHLHCHNNGVLGNDTHLLSQSASSSSSLNTNGQLMMTRFTPSDHHRQDDNNIFHDYLDDDHQIDSGSATQLVSNEYDIHDLVLKKNKSVHHHHHNHNHNQEEQPLTMGSAAADGIQGEKKKKVKKTKNAFQTRSQVDILDDGYRWRKYGQKAVKNNKFPRSYYRCTYQGCNVKKQVQRLTKDEGLVITTYEGMHTHPIEKPSDNFEHILSQMQIYTPF
ncbi:Probable WRKY transcription factor 75 [Linum perenne]